MKKVYLLVNCGGKIYTAMHVTDVLEKAECWRELLIEQGTDTQVVLVDEVLLDSIDAISSK